MTRERAALCTQLWPHSPIISSLSVPPPWQSWAFCPSAELCQESCLTITLQTSVHPRTPTMALLPRASRNFPSSTALQIDLETVALPSPQCRRRSWKAILLTPGCWHGNRLRSLAYCFPHSRVPFSSYFFSPNELPDFGRAPFSISPCIRVQI